MRSFMELLENRPTDVVANWVIDKLPFDAIYYYTPQRPFHVSWSPVPRSAKNGRFYPSMIGRGPAIPDGAA